MSTAVQEELGTHDDLPPLGEESDPDENGKKEDDQKPQAADPEPEPTGSSQRTYLVFKKIEKDTFKKIGEKTASNPEAALRAFGFKDPEHNGSYSAVPERNWSEVELDIEQTTTVKITPK